VNDWPAMTIALERAPTMLGSTKNSTEPLPVPPPAPAMMVIHPAVLATVHAQPEGADTAIDLVPPNGVSEALVGLRAYVHEGGGGGGGGGAAAADWVTVKVRPAIVNTPLRSAPVFAFAAAVKPTEPLPVPAAPDVTVSQAALLTAVQEHVAVVVTPTCPDPPPAAIV
jgi:hypothetical protein